MKDLVVHSCLDPVAILSAVTNINISSSAGNRTPILWPVLIAVFTELFGSYLSKYAVEVSASSPTILSFSCVIFQTNAAIVVCLQIGHDCSLLNPRLLPFFQTSQ